MFLSSLALAFLVIVIAAVVCLFIRARDIPSAKKRNHPNRRAIHIACRLGLFTLAPLLFATPAHASIFQGEALDSLAGVLSWVVLIIAPTVGIAVFWMLHILPEKIAEKRNHPQAKAIQTLCLLSLFFGGMLWPIAWLWAYSKPVLYKMAYGTDKVIHGEDDSAHPPPPADEVQSAELERLRKRVAELEGKPAGKSAAERAKA